MSPIMSGHRHDHVRGRVWQASIIRQFQLLKFELETPRDHCFLDTWQQFDFL